MKVLELEGAELDYWVAEVVNPKDYHDGWFTDANLPDHANYTQFTPSTDWSQGGPLLEQYGINTRVHCAANGVPTSWVGSKYWPMDKLDGRIGPTKLVAGMRALVASKYGENVPCHS